MNQLIPLQTQGRVINALLATVVAAVVATSATLSIAVAQQPVSKDVAPANTSLAKKSSAKVLSRAELDVLLTRPEKVLLIDVRRPDELSTIGGFSVYLSIQAQDLEKSLAFIPRDRAIVTVSNHAGRAGNAADLLTAKGFNVAGAVGAQTYEQEGGSLIRIAPPAPKTADAGK